MEENRESLIQMESILSELSKAHPMNRIEERFVSAGGMK